MFYGEEFASLMDSDEMRFPATPRTHIRLVCAQVYPGLPARPPDFPSVDAAGLAPVVQFGRINVPQERLADFNGWYSRDRGPLCEKVPGVRRMRRYSPVEGERLMIVLYEMEDESVRETPEWKRMNASDGRRACGATTARSPAPPASTGAGATRGRTCLILRLTAQYPAFDVADFRVAGNTLCKFAYHDIDHAE